MVGNTNRHEGKALPASQAAFGAMCSLEVVKARGNARMLRVVNWWLDGVKEGEAIPAD